MATKSGSSRLHVCDITWGECSLLAVLISLRFCLADPGKKFLKGLSEPWCMYSAPWLWLIQAPEVKFGPEKLRWGAHLRLRLIIRTRYLHIQIKVLSQGNPVTLPDSGLKYSPFQICISFLLLPWVFFWLNQAKSKACCLNTPLHCMSESQNSFKRSHLTQKINHDGHCINHALLLFPSTVHDTVRNDGFQALQIGQGDTMNLQKYIRYKHRECNQIC